MTVDSYTQEFRVEDKVMHVRLSGTFPNERLAMKENLFRPLIDACRKDHCPMAIVDARQLQVDFDTTALFRAGVDAASMNEFGLCVALVGRDDMIDPFFDDVTHNRGARVKVFTDMEHARIWVNERRPRSEPARESA
jgi:hypothetical protein